jgi:DNA-binding LacI/PurR family transcriptional regulator
MPRLIATIREVAARAGVSHQTVSRVINGSERVNPETKQKVELAIAELGYAPNAIARFMAHGHTRTFACLSPNLTDYTFASIIDGAEREARRQKYFMITASAPDADAFGSLVEQLVYSRQTDALLVINPYVDERYTHLPKNVPTVFLGAKPRGELVDAVVLDDELAGLDAAEHLLALGHRKIAVIAGPLVEDCSQARLNGYRVALCKAGICEEPTLAYEGDWSASSGHRAVNEFIKTGQEFSAIFAQNDRMAVGAIQALREIGQRVPEDVSVIGFDDMPLASYFDPPLTTMRQDPFLIGREAARLLICSLEDSSSTRQVVQIPAELIWRKSTIAKEVVARRMTGLVY